MVSVHELISISEAILSGRERKRGRKRACAEESFVALFKVTPFVAMEVWEHLQEHTNIPWQIKPKHFLWTLFFLKHCMTERSAAVLLGCDRKTYRYYIWCVIDYVALLKDKVILWENRLESSAAAKVSVDGTDFRTVEYYPFDPWRCSHKFKCAALRYEVAIAIKTGFIVHVKGPFKAGTWTDKKIVKLELHGKLAPGEYYLADGGYTNKNAPVITKNTIPQHERAKMNAIMARHETINGRFKDWQILENRFRHGEHRHRGVFTAIAVITQVEIETGMHVFGVSKHNIWYCFIKMIHIKEYNSKIKYSALKY
ncbi:unnamed protein product [Cylindrotheca closterium]|uniref:DDE Tnp4 domain-containing protein n=1 Tax=Cylindrotheca closterium TaxID=2856 RepID=A0AAD2FWI5_9STRA|nr:unnamed protein product [Cylindrotheca closterium]